MSGFDIGARHVGDGAPCFVIAEVGLAHDGSLSQAHAYIDAVAARGVDAVKFQCHLGDPVSEWRTVPLWQTDQDKNRQTYWKRTGFTQEQWHALSHHAVLQCGIEFLCSPFSVEAVKMLDPLVPAWKVPSGQVTNRPLLQAIADTGKPPLISTGLATSREIRELYDIFPQLMLLHCSSLYPCPPEKVDLNECRYVHGLSDHSGTIYAGLAAVALGCDVLEVHVCFSKEQGGFDTAASLDMEQLGHLVEGVRFIEKAKQPVDKDALAKELEPVRKVFMREGV